MERDADVYRYQGQAYSWIGFDEITHLPTEFAWNYLAHDYVLQTQRLSRTCVVQLTPVAQELIGLRSGTLTPLPPNDSFRGADGLTRKFIPARLQDNPYLAEDGRYEQMLNALPPTQRQQLLDGNWDVAEGAAFVEFNPV